MLIQHCPTQVLLRDTGGAKPTSTSSRVNCVLLTLMFIFGEDIPAQGKVIILLISF
jgi:hypothetical protein